MTDTLDPPVPPVSGPPAGGGDRVEPVDIQQEMQRSYIDYAMSVIVGRALPLVEDGLKPVHRRVLYSMGENGFRPDRSYVKCARVVGEVMGNYHPHGDSSIYDALVRLAQPWSMRYPLIDGQGNFGSRGNDPAAAMRYCLTGDTRVRMADGSSVRIDAIVPDAAPQSDNPVDLKVLDRSGDPVHAEMLFHSGEHPTLRVSHRRGVRAHGNTQPPGAVPGGRAGDPHALVEAAGGGAPGRPGGAAADCTRGFRGLDPSRTRPRPSCWVLSSARASSPTGRAGFNNVDEEYFSLVLAAYDSVVGGPRYVYSRTDRVRLESFTSSTFKT